MVHQEEKNLDYKNEKYLAISIIARHAKDLSRQHQQSHGNMGGDHGFDPIDAALEDFNREKLSAFRRNELTGELEKY